MVQIGMNQCDCLNVRTVHEVRPKKTGMNWHVMLLYKGPTRGLHKKEQIHKWSELVQINHQNLLKLNAKRVK